MIGLIADGADVAAVAESTSAAAATGLDRAEKDPGLSYPFFLLTRIALSARQPDFAASLRTADIRVGDAPDVMDVVSAFSAAADQRLRAAGRTDLGEIARLAATEALTGLLGARSSNLFERTPAEVRQAARSMSTQGARHG